MAWRADCCGGDLEEMFPHRNVYVECSTRYASTDIYTFDPDDDSLELDYSREDYGESTGPYEYSCACPNCGCTWFEDRPSVPDLCEFFTYIEDEDEDDYNDEEPEAAGGYKPPPMDSEVARILNKVK